MIIYSEKAQKPKMHSTKSLNLFSIYRRCLMLKISSGIQIGATLEQPSYFKNWFLKKIFLQQFWRYRVAQGNGKFIVIHTMFKITVVLKTYTKLNQISYQDLDRVVMRVN